MTDKQPEALELASVAESADLAGYPTAKKANAYCLCLLEDCAQMIRRLHAENETLRAGYAAARLEVESLKAQLVERASHGQAPAGATEEVENLRKALVYAAFALHDTPQYMLAQGITLIDGDTVRVSRDGWTVEASVNPHRQPAQAAEPVALLVRKNSWRDGQWEVAPPNSPSYGLAWADQRMYVYTTPQPTQPQAGAVPLTDEYPALVCDYCGALTPDPWHSSGMLRGKMSKHIHSCDACCRGAAQAAPTAVAGPVVNRATVIEWLDANDIEVTDRQMDGLFHFAAPTTQPAHQQEESKPHGWLYDWTHSSATGKPDTTYTGFTKDEAHARKHDNCTAIYTSPQPAPQQEALEQAGERVYAFRRKGLADFCTCDEARYEELSNKPHLFETRIFYTAPQPAPAPAEPDQYGVEFGMSGTHMHFKIGNQLFKLAYEPDEQEEFDFMKRMLVNAFTTFTHDVKTAPQPSPAAQGDALSDEAVRVPLDSLHADAAYLIGRLREGSMPYARVIEIIRERIDAAKAAIRARAAQGDAQESEYRRGYRHGYEQRDAEVRGALV